MSFLHRVPWVHRKRDMQRRMAHRDAKMLYVSQSICPSLTAPRFGYFFLISSKDSWIDSRSWACFRALVRFHLYRRRLTVVLLCTTYYSIARFLDTGCCSPQAILSYIKVFPTQFCNSIVTMPQRIIDCDCRLNDVVRSCENVQHEGLQPM